MHLRNWLSGLKKEHKTDFLSYKEQVKKVIDLSMLKPAGRPGLVSVVLPVWNGERYLDEAVRSVLAQTYKDFELIIVDDGSTDNSLGIAEKFAERDSRIKLICHSENRKLPSALNTGFDAASGEFYTWISHDNILLPEYLSKMVSELSEKKSAAMVYGNMSLIDSKGRALRGKGWYEIPPMSGRVMLPHSTSVLNDEANNTIGAAFVYRASAAKYIGEYSCRRFGIEDYDYWMRMNEVFEIAHTSFDEPLYLYRFHDLSLTARDAELKITEERPQLMAFDSERRRRILAVLKSGADADEMQTLIKEIVRTV